MKKRIVSFLMALVMVVSLLPVSAFAVEDAASSDVPAVEAQEVQPVEEQQDENADIEENGIQVYAAPKDTVTSLDSMPYVDGAKYTEGGKEYKVRSYSIKEGCDFSITIKEPDPYDTTGEKTYQVYGLAHTLGTLPETQKYTPSADTNRTTLQKGTKYQELPDSLKSLFSDDSHVRTYHFLYKVEKLKNGTTSSGKVQYKYDTVADTVEVLVLDWGADTTVKTDALDKALPASAPIADNYYTENDCYNGKTTIGDLVATLKANVKIKADSSLTVLNKTYTSFWALYAAAMDRVNAIYPETGGKRTLASGTVQTQVDAAAELLSAAIANLIPATQLNATALYEAVQQYSGTSENSSYSEENLKSKTTATVNAFKAARSDAEEYLASLFDENGATDENKAANQSKADGYVTALKEAAEGLVDKVNAYVQPDFDNAVSGIRLYSKLYDPEKLTKSDYTAESWAAYKAAYDAAQAALKKAPFFNTEMPGTAVNEITKAFSDFRNACHGLVENKSQITVTISLTDKYAVQKNADSIATVTSRVTLTPGATVGDALSKLGVSAPSDTRNFAEYCAYINGVQCYTIASAGLNGSVSNPSDYVHLGLHDGDEVVIAKLYPKIYKNISELDTPCAANMVLEHLKHQRITTSLTNNRVKAGESFTVTVTAANAMPSQRTGSYNPVSGAALYMGAASADQATAEKAPITTNLQVSTNASGQATVTLYESGWCLLYAYDLTENGTYTNGAATLIYVEPADDLAAIRTKLADELTAIAKDPNYPESYFLPDDWSAIQTAYTDALATIQNAETADAARTAQLAAMGTIRAKQSAADEYNVNNLASFRNYLNSLPEDLTKLDKSAESTIQYMVKRYEQMTGYQKDQLMQVEKTRYAAIKAAYDKGLKDAVQYQLKVEYDLSGVPEADRAGLQAMIQWLKKNTTRDGGDGEPLGRTQMAELFTFNDAQHTMYNTKYTQVTSATAGSSIYFCDNPAYAAFMHMKAGRTMDRDGKKITDAKASYPMMVDGNEYAIADGVWQIEDMQAQGKTSVSADGLRYTVNGHAYVLRGITYSGVTSEVRDCAFDVFDYSDYMGRNQNGNTNYKAVTILHSFKSLEMPYNDVTVTITWAPEGGTDDELSAAKTTAISRLDALKNSLSGDGVQAAYDAGVKAINAATSVSDVESAYQAAVKNMRTAANNYGTVEVIVENQTFLEPVGGNEPAWKGVILREKEAKLEADSTMMSVLLHTLEKYGYSWAGTGSTGDKYHLGYLSAITKDGRTLAEFSGGEQSGWMGTLNDWFTNESFDEFGVANGKLADGDVIRIMYTCNGYGADIGGSWDNSDTTLASLKVKGGKLLTVFSSGEAGGSYEYVLAINDDKADIQLTPTAANKNFLTKIFLNEKVTSNNEGSSFYKRTQTIPVKAGDVIYVGCGERAWPTMNNQAGNTQKNDGTWYVLRVINTNADAGAVESMIDELPELSAVSYSNYQQYMNAVAAARASYNALSKAQQKAVADSGKLAELEKLEQAVAGFQAIDEVKSKLDKLPGAGDLTSKDQEAVKAAQDAYDKLTDEQKEYLSAGQVKKMDEVTTRMDEIIKENPTPTPGNTGNGGTGGGFGNSGKKDATKTTGKDVKSGNTGDTGVTLYVGMALVAVLAGAVVIARKRKEN